MNNLKMRSFTRVFGIVACVLLIVAFPLYYPFVRAYVMRLRDASKTSQRRLSFLDKADLSVEYELNKRMRGLGLGLYRLTGGRIARLYKAEVLLLTTRGRRSGHEPFYAHTSSHLERGGIHEHVASKKIIGRD